MFDMNDVWESWFTQRIKIAVRKLDIDVQVRAQAKKIFWYGDTGERVRLKPDIIIETDDKPQFILTPSGKSSVIDLQR
jgi:5-methylcytosine-specific restriction endonuclease McrBC regulatory subunit McrC